MLAVVVLQAVALGGAYVTGTLARRRREEMERLNDKLRTINAQLRRQWQSDSSGDCEDDDFEAAFAEAGSVAAATASMGGDAEAAAQEALAAAAAEMAAARSALEHSLRAPSAAHPTEGLGPGGRLSLASARRRLATAIRDTKLLLRAAAAADGAPSSSSSGTDPLDRCFALLDEAECLGEEMSDMRAVRAVVRLRAKALRLAGDLPGSARELRRVLALTQQLGLALGADMLGELGDVLTELGDYAAAADLYDQCIAAIQADAGASVAGSALASTWDV